MKYEEIKEWKVNVFEMKSLLFFNKDILFAKTSYSSDQTIFYFSVIRRTFIFPGIYRNSTTSC
jgi:hypothetical protein